MAETKLALFANAHAQISFEHAQYEKPLRNPTYVRSQSYVIQEAVCRGIIAKSFLFKYFFENEYFLHE